MILTLLVSVALMPPAQETDRELRRLVDQLGDPSIQVRERAAKELVDLGEDALPILRSQAALVHSDAELRTRAAAVLETLQWKAAEKKFQDRIRQGKKWERLLDEKLLKVSPKFRIYAEQADETSWPTVAAVARDGTITEAQGIGVVNTFLPFVFGEFKAAADQERRELREACMMVLKRSLPLKSGITVELDGLLRFLPERDDRDERGGLRAGFTVNYPKWGPHVGVTLAFEGEGRLAALTRQAWSLEWVYEKEGEHLRRESRLKER
jgi:hypothetical protein